MSVTTAESNSDPTHPRRFEKKKNTGLPLAQSGGERVGGDVLLSLIWAHAFADLGEKVEPSREDVH